MMSISIRNSLLCTSKHSNNSQFTNRRRRKRKQIHRTAKKNKIEIAYECADRSTNKHTHRLDILG